MEGIIASGSFSGRPQNRLVTARGATVPNSVPKAPCPQPPPFRPAPQTLKAVIGVNPGMAEKVQGWVTAPPAAADEEPLTKILGPLGPQLFPMPAPAPQPRPAWDRIPYQFLIDVESTGAKQLPWDTTDFEEFCLALKAPRLPRIGIVDLMSPGSAASPPTPTASLLQQPADSWEVKQATASGRRITLVLWLLDTHPEMYRRLYYSGFVTLRRLLPDFVQVMIARSEAELSFENVYHAGQPQPTSAPWVRHVPPVFTLEPVYPLPLPPAPAQAMPVPSPFPSPLPDGLGKSVEDKEEEEEKDSEEEEEDEEEGFESKLHEAATDHERIGNKKDVDLSDEMKELAADDSTGEDEKAAKKTNDKKLDDTPTLLQRRRAMSLSAAAAALHQTRTLR